MDAFSARPSSARMRASPIPEALRTALTLQRFTDVQALLALDPVHDVDEVGWPVKAPATDL